MCFYHSIISRSQIIFYLEISAKMVRLEFEFSFDCKELAFNFRVGSKPCACKTSATAQEPPSAKRNSGNNVTQINDPMLLRSSGLSHLKDEETSGLPLHVPQ